MRRPAFCGGGAATEDDCYCTGPLVSPDVPDTDEGRLAKVKRILTGTLLMGRRGRVFGVRLEELPAGREGLPQIAVRLCGFIENYGLKCAGLFRLSAGNPKLVERLRVSFDRTGDADLEAAADPQSVASLLKLWLRELPEPIISTDVAEELLDIQEKFHGELCEWREAVCQALLALPDANLHLLHYLLRFLHRYDQHSHPPKCHYISNGGIATVFAPLLIAGARSQIGRSNVATQLMGKMIRDMKHIFQGRFVEHAYQAAVGGDWPISAPTGNNRNLKEPGCLQRKRKERHGSSSQSQERKVIRSNSEERPLENGDRDNIRRVSSHEDFSLVKVNNKNKSCFLSELIDPTLEHGVRYSMPLHDHNSTVLSHSHHSHPAHHSHHHHHKPTNEEDFNAILDEEHERRRRSERNARSVAPRGRRNLARRRKVHRSHQQQAEDRDSGSSSKENEDDGENSRNANQLTPVSSSTSDDDSSSKEGSRSHSFLQLHPQERERSPSPSPSPATPPLDTTTLHELVDRNEPLKAMGPWSFAHRQPEEELVTSHVMLSPRNSMVLTRRVNLDPNIPPSPPQEHLTRVDRPQAQEDKLKQLNKQINSVKRKLKRYEEDFEAEYGYRASHSDKMANREVKKLCAELNRLRKEIKVLKEESHVTFLAKPIGLRVSEDAHHTSAAKAGKNVSMEDTLEDVENHLQEKRQLANRPSNLEELTRDQLFDEKVAVQKSLLYLESVFGRPVSRVERDLVRPLYDRYRALKRMVIRTGSSKLKDSVSELATILEHETMDFTSSLPPSTNEEPPAVSDPVVPTLDSQQLENLHALPLSQLLVQQRTVREDKKSLRRSLREFEDDFQRRTGKKLQKEDRLQMDPVYNAYKQAKAKLRLLEALVTKQTS